MGVMSRPMTNVMTEVTSNVMGPYSGSPPSDVSDLYKINDNSSDNLILGDVGSDRLLVKA